MLPRTQLSVETLNVTFDGSLRLNSAVQPGRRVLLLLLAERKWAELTLLMGSPRSWWPSGL